MADVAEPKPVPVSTTQRMTGEVAQTYRRVEQAVIATERRQSHFGLGDLLCFMGLGAIVATTPWPLPLIGIVLVMGMAVRGAVRA